MRVLVVEDDTSLLKVIRDIFEGEAFLTDAAETGDEGYYLAGQAIHDLIVLNEAICRVGIAGSIKSRSKETRNNRSGR